MEEEKCDCRVIFKMTPIDRNYPISECIAFLLDVIANDDRIMSYMHIGQHGEASVGFFRECRPATPDEYGDLMQELGDIGYNVIPRLRWIK